MQWIQDLRRGTEDLFQTLSEGWRRLMARSSQALTRFRRKGDAPSEVPLQEESWGLLAAEVFEGESDVVVKLEVPGMSEDDLEIEVQGSYLRVRGEKRFGPVEERRGHYHVFEAAYGSFERILPLPTEVETDRAEATYRRGVLEVRLPKRGGGGFRRIPVRNA